MARSNTGSTSNWLSNANAPVTAMPLTMACWAFGANTTAYHNLITINAAAGTYHYWTLALGGDRAGDPVTAETNDNSGMESYADSTAGYTANTWVHACAVFASSTSRSAYLNGANKGTNTDSNATTGVSRVQLGAYDDGAVRYGPISGRICHATIWDIVLSDTEVSILPYVDHRTVRPNNIAAHWELWGIDSPEPDHKFRLLTTTGYPLTINGTMAAAAHGPAPNYSRRWWRATFQRAPTTNAYTLPIDGGVYSLTGSAVGLKRGYPIVVSGGTYDLTGAAVGLKRGYPIVVSGGTYNTTGADVALRHAWNTAFDGGSYSLTGGDVGLKRGYPIVVGAGAYTLNGSNVALRAAKSLAFDGGVYTVNGTDAFFRKGPVLTTDSGSYTLNGSNVSLLATRNVVIGSGSYALNGSAVTVKKGYPIVVGSGSYALNGSDTSLRHAYNIGISPGAYNVGGSSVSFTLAHNVGIGSGVYGLTGSLVSLRKDSRLTLDSGVYVLNGSAVGLQYSEEVTAVGLLRGSVSVRVPSGVAVGRTPTLSVSARTPDGIAEGRG